RRAGGEGPVVVRERAWLLEAKAPDPPPRIRPAAALSSTRRYLDYSAHSTPFDPARLLDFWQRCGRTPAAIERCAPGLRIAEQLVAGGRPPAGKPWLAPAPEDEARSAARAKLRERADDETVEEEAAGDAP